MENLRNAVMGNKFEVELTDEEAALIYLYRCLDEPRKGGVMNYTAFAYTQLTRKAILHNKRNAAQVNREEVADGG